MNKGLGVRDGGLVRAVLKTARLTCFPILFFISVSGIYSETHYLDLQTAKQLALKHNPNLQRALMDFSSAEESFYATRTQNFPSVKLDLISPNFNESLNEQYVYNPSNGTYGWQWVPTGDFRYQGSLNLEQKLPSGGSVNIISMLYKRDYYIGSQSDSLNTEYSSILQFRIQQPFLQPNAFRLEQRRSYLNYTSSRLEREIQLRDLDYVIGLVYYTLLRADRSLKLEIEDFQRWQNSVEIALKKFQAGLIPEVEVLKLQVELARREGNLVAAYNNYLSASENLKIALDISLADSIALSEEVERLNFQERDISQSIDLRQELKKADIALKNAELNYKQAKANAGIDAFLQFYYNFDAKEPLLDDLMDNMRQDRGVSLTLTIPILDWNASRHTVEANAIAFRRSRFDFEQERKTLMVEMLQAQRQLKSSESRLVSAELAKNLADKSYEMTLARFESGAITSTELIDAQISLNQSRQDYLNSLIDFNISVMRYNSLYFPDKLEGN
jgi:outer membrane protein TolC